MRTVEIAPGIHSSILGFGCAPIQGAIGGSTALRALDTAYECGINHLDLARSYGYGEAEKFVGKWLKGKRDEMVVVSKFGIRATWKAHVFRPLKPIVRRLKANHKTNPISPNPNSTRKDPFHERIPFRASEMIKSLEASLKALGTDYLDVFLVHEPKQALEGITELLETALKLKQDGKIKAWGIAFDWEDRLLFEQHFHSFDILQFNNSPHSRHYQASIEEFSHRPNILFSPLRTRGEMSPKETFQTLWNAFPQSVILCSMYDPAHIHANVNYADVH